MYAFYVGLDNPNQTLNVQKKWNEKVMYILGQDSVNGKELILTLLS